MSDTAFAHGQNEEIDILNCTASTDHTFSTLDSGTETPSPLLVDNDPFEGTLYRTHASETKINIHFLTNVLYESFQKKIHSDFMSSVEIDDTSFLSKCTTHIKGAKCNIKLDSHFKSIELSGIGCKLWREERFPKITQSLFKKLMQELDSQLEDPSHSEYSSEGSRDFGVQQDLGVQQRAPICDSLFDDGNDVNVAPNCDVPLSGNVAPNCNVLTSANVAEKCNVETISVGINSDSVAQKHPVSSHIEKQPKNKSFTAENITESYMSSVKLATTFAPGIHAPLREDCQSVPMNYGILSETVPDRMPTFTSTPIASRQEQPCNSAAASTSIYSILGKIDQLDSGIKSIKKDILQQMECKLNALKISVVSMIENLVTNRTYADACRSTHSVQEVEQLNRSRSSTSYVDEGYGDQSGTSVNGALSQTQLKTLYVPDTTDNQQRTRTKYIPQPIPVRMTNRSTLNQRQATKDSSIKSVNRENNTVHHKRTLIMVTPS